MISDFEFYHGSVICKLIHKANKEIAIQIYPSANNSSYILNNKVGIYIKYSTQRMSPWNFTFKKEHQDEVEDMNKLLEKVFILLVCYDDGIVCLNYKEFKMILDEHHEKVEWVSASRKSGGMYTVKGKNGKLRFKIGKKDFPKKIFSDSSLILT